jgi:hypothetical protein
MLQIVPLDDPGNGQRPPSLKRQVWFEAVVLALRVRFAAAGYTIPNQVRISVGWPKSAPCGIAGACFPDALSSDAHFEMFIVPEMTDATTLIAVAAHEVAHVAVGNAAGHGPLFKRCALAVGLIGRMTATTAGPEFTAWAAALLAQIGPYPAGSISIPTKQSTRLLRCECKRCGYAARVSRKWLAVGAPICPTDSIPMSTTASQDAS